MQLPVIQDRSMQTRLIPLLAALATALSGCQTLTSIFSASPTPAAVEESSPTPVASKPYYTYGIGQARAERAAYYVLCDPCAAPTPKTLLPSAPPAQPVAILPPFKEPEPRVELFPVEEEKAEPAPTPPAAPAVTEAPPAPTGVPAANKRLVPFGFGRAKLGPLGREAMAALLEEAKSAARIHVRGYTDILGQMPANKRLEQGRAEAIQAWLVKEGVDPARISVSHCIDCFIESNESETGREANRRAVVVMRPAVEGLDKIDLDRRDPCRSDVAPVKVATSRQ
jgi:outer membrane protein OmpA-like peptidoglycan-associated protein